jgi:2-hydroxy-3-keto-5-methylthiopentenyl-1-phosphate phosphatase
MPPSGHLKHKIVFFTDFDGTITREDICDWLV